MCSCVVYYVLPCSADEITVKTVNGLHELLVPMESRQVICRFTLRPYAHTLGDFVNSILEEDKAIHQVHAENEGNLRFLLHPAKHCSTPVHLLITARFAWKQITVVYNYHVIYVVSNVLL